MPGPGKDDLVEPEGVNAGSGVSEDKSDTAADVTAGGSPERASEALDQPPAATELLGAPGDQPGAPGQQLAAGEG